MQNGIRLSAGVLFVLLLIGCTADQRPATHEQSERLASGSITATELGRRLGFALVESDGSFAKLCAGPHTLMVFTSPIAGIYLNGWLVVRTPDIVRHDGQVYVPAGVEGPVRQALQSMVQPRPIVPAPIPSRPPARGPVAGRVVLDPGHGGKDPGAGASSGLAEKTVTLNVALAAAEKLRRRGVSVLLTRTTDRFIELADRAGAANGFHANLFVSIHADDNPSPAKYGHTVILPRSNSAKELLAGQCLDRQLVAVGSPSHAVRTDDRGLFVLRKTTCPAVLVELGFLSNAWEAARLRNGDFQDRLAEAVADGIMDYLGQQASR